MNKDHFGYPNTRIVELEEEVKRLNTPPYCPRCKSEQVTIKALPQNNWMAECGSCGKWSSGKGKFMEAINNWTAYK